MLHISAIFAFPPHRTLLFRFLKLFKGEIRLFPDSLQDRLLRGFSDVSAINSVRVAGDACVAFVAADVCEVARVLRGGGSGSCSCSCEHIRQRLSGQGKESLART